MAIGRTFQESFQKAIRGLEIGKDGLNTIFDSETQDMTSLKRELSIASPDRIWYLGDALRLGLSPGEIHDLSKIDLWFISQIQDLIDEEIYLEDQKIEALEKEYLFLLKQKGFSDSRLASLLGVSESKVREKRLKLNIKPVYKRVDTCAAEFTAQTPYCYSSYEQYSDVLPLEGKKVIILGGGPNRIGQGIEFDYCCVQAVFGLQDQGYKTIMVNCNPETVSTDFDLVDRLYFEPVTFEDVLNIVEFEKPDGVLVQFGGQTPLKIANALADAGVPVIGTSPQSIDLAEDREKFGKILDKLKVVCPQYGTGRTLDEVVTVAERIGFPVLARPSYVLGGRAMEIVYSREQLIDYIARSADVTEGHPILIDEFLEDAFEFDVDALCDGESVHIGAVMQHIEEAGIHSGDSACVLPPYRITTEAMDEIIRITKALSIELKVIGLINLQFAYKDGEVYVLEVNPRASRTIPFVSKATNTPLARIASQLATGSKLSNFDLKQWDSNHHIAVKEAVLPFNKFPEESIFLSPEMKSTGEVMGISNTFGQSFRRASISSGNKISDSGTVFISVNNSDKLDVIPIARDLYEIGFVILATSGTARELSRNGIPVDPIFKVGEGRPNIVDAIKNDNINLVINTPMGERSRYDEEAIGRACIQKGIVAITTLSGAEAAVRAIRLAGQKINVRSIQEYHQ